MAVGTYYASCDRCGKLFNVDFSFEIIENLVQEQTLELKDDVILIEENKIDISQIIISNIIINMPMKFVCYDDCKGLCANCGANLNIEKCSCNKKEIDSRLSVLKSLLKD